MEAILRKRLKTWQKEFRLTHGGREPRRSDIAKVPEIAALYETWTALGAAASVAETSDKGKQKQREPSAVEDRKKRSRGGNEEASTHTQEKRHRPVPTTPTKARPARSTGHDGPFKTPTKPAASSASSSQAGPTTPHRPASVSSSRNPFQTPTKDAAHSGSPTGPTTPSSAVKLRTPRAQQQPDAVSPSKAATSLDPSFHFDYNKSPSSFRTLVGQHSTSRSPNRRPTAAASQAAYTPRTKARKRLRGDEVPPTPESARRAQMTGDDGGAGSVAGSSSRILLSSPSKTRSIARSASSSDATLQPGPIDPRPRKRRAERALSAYWGNSGTGGLGTRGDSQPTEVSQQFKRTVSQPQTALEAQRRTKTPSADDGDDEDADNADGDEDDEADGDDDRILQASPSTRPRSSLNNPPPVSPSASRPKRHQWPASPSRKFHSLFGDDGTSTGPVAINDGDEAHDDDDLQLEDALDPQEVDAHFAAPSPRRKTNQATSADNVLIADLSSSSESDTAQSSRRKGKSKSTAAASTSRSTATPSTSTTSPSKAAYIRTYRRLGALSLSRHHSASNTATPGDDSDGDDDGLTSDEWNPARFLASRKVAIGGDAPPSMVAEKDDEDDDIPSLPGHVLNRRPRALRNIQHAQQTRESSVLSRLGVLDDDDKDKDNEVAPPTITLENAEDALGVKLDRSGFKACAEGQETNENDYRKNSASEGPPTWGAAKAANKKNKSRYTNVDDDDLQFAPKDKKGNLLLGKAKRGWNGSLGTFVASDDEEDGGVATASKSRAGANANGSGAAATSAPRSLVFKRTGRSGVDDDEATQDMPSVHAARPHEDEEWSDAGPADIDTQESDNDDDWQSDVDSVDWGLGDGRMDDVDVM